MAIEVLRNRDELSHARIQDVQVGEMRTSFIQLIDNSTSPANTLHKVEAQVDLDENGDIVGVSLLWSDEGEACEPMRLGSSYAG